MAEIDIVAIKELHDYMETDREGNVYGSRSPSNGEIKDKINEIIKTLNNFMRVQSGITPKY